MLRPLAIGIGMLAAMIPAHAAAQRLDRTSDGHTMRLSKKDDEAIMSHPMELLAHPPLTTHCGFNHQNLNGSNLSVAAAPCVLATDGLSPPLDLEHRRGMLALTRAPPMVLWHRCRAVTRLRERYDIFPPALRANPYCAEFVQFRTAQSAALPYA